MAADTSLSVPFSESGFGDGADGMGLGRRGLCCPLATPPSGGIVAAAVMARLSTASERLATFILASSAVMCFFTMSKLMPSCLAMSGLVSPRVRDSSICRRRGESDEYGGISHVDILPYFRVPPTLPESVRCDSDAFRRFRVGCPLAAAPPLSRALRAL